MVSKYFTVVLINEAKFSNPCHALQNGAAVKGLKGHTYILCKQTNTLRIYKHMHTRKHMHKHMHTQSENS